MFQAKVRSKRCVCLALALLGVSVAASLFHTEATPPRPAGREGRGNETLFVHAGLSTPSATFATSDALLKDLASQGGGGAARRRYRELYVTFVDGAAQEPLRQLYARHGFRILEVGGVFRTEALRGLPLYEFPTLYNLWAFCQRNPAYSVTYMHTLGASKAWSFRRAMTRHVLQAQLMHDDDECPSEGAWHCGPNAQRWPCWEHYSGNFWKASCEHVNHLEAPTLSVEGFRSAKYAPEKGFDVCFPAGPLGRFWAEAWIVHGLRDPKASRPLCEIKRAARTNAFYLFIHRAYFEHGWQPLRHIEKIRRAVGLF